MQPTNPVINHVLLLLVKHAEFLSHRSLTAVHVLAAKVVPIKEHELNSVALVQGDQEDKQEKNGAQSTGQLDCVHELC